MIGTKLAHYEVTAHLGSGGMGDVYQATDSKLGRSVAIKLLPDAFAHDAERAARFEREARVLASLNHPNVAAIYGIEQSGERKFLVMELVPGETIAERIKRGPIPVNEALEIAKQIAEALEAAHDSEKGIIHRDLKPANVKITPDGKVKVLDFGLAKAFAGEAANANLSNSPTLSIAATNAGVILGTAAYMSPEQAKGRAVDRRTDIFAFGCVLYEMLTGRPAFEGEDLQDILGAVLKSEPDWTRLPGETPSDIRKLLRRCLEKNARNRHRDAAEVRINIEDALTEPVVAAPVTLPARRSSLAWIAFATAVLVAAFGIFVGLRPVPPLPEMRTEINTPATADPTSFALSPDGRQIVFVASGDAQPRLWLRPLDKVTAAPLEGTEGASHPFWSPDSRSIGFFAGSKLKRIDIGVGLPQTLADAAFPRGGTWSVEGVIVFGPSQDLFRVSATGGEINALTKLGAGQTSHRVPQFLPNGRQFLYYAIGTPETQGVYLGSLDSSEAKRLTVADTSAAYAPAGWLLYIRQGTLVARRFDNARGELTGDPIPVADPVDVGSNNKGAFSVSAAGLVAYRGVAKDRRQLIWFDRSGKALGAFGPADESGLLSPEISPDGRRVAVSRTIQSKTDVWLQDAGRVTRFTFSVGANQFPTWSPDGSRIVFNGNQSGSELYEKLTSSAETEKLLVESPQTNVPHDWSADGRFLLYHSVDPQTQRDLWILPMEGDRKPSVFLKTNFDERFGQFSPDGRWVAYESNESGQYEIYVRQFPGAGSQLQVSTSGGIWPRWHPDGKELYYMAPDGKLTAVPIAVTGTMVEPGVPAPLFQPRIARNSGGNPTDQQYDVASDGRFLINTVLDDAVTPIIILQNWKPPAN